MGFSDLDQWLMKLVLLRSAPGPWWWSAEAHEPLPLENALQLARAGSVSPPTAVRLVQALENDGYLERQRWRTMRLLRPEDLLEECRGRYRLADNHPQPFGPDPYALPASGWRPEILRRLKSGPPFRYAVSGFAACEAAGVTCAVGDLVVHIYVDCEFDAAAGALDLVPEPLARGRDLVYLIRPRFPQAVFRAAVSLDGLAVVDPIQAYLDLYHRFDAGREQAEHIFDRVIAPQLGAPRHGRGGDARVLRDESRER